MDIENLAKKHLVFWIVSIVSVSVGITWKVSEEIMVKPRDFEIERYKERIKEFEGKLAKKNLAQPSTVEINHANSPPELGELLLSFIEPSNGGYVNQFSNVKYNVSGEPPEGYSIILFVQDPIGQFWSHGTSNSHEYKRVQFGAAEDSGREFNLYTVVTNITVPLGQSSMVLPNNVIYQKSITVRRN